MHATWGERGEVTNQKGNYASIPLASNIVHRVTSKCRNSIWISVMVDFGRATEIYRNSEISVDNKDLAVFSKSKQYI